MASSPFADQPQATLSPIPEAQSRPLSEFDPMQNAKICSPFYQYNHDSPRPSQDLRVPSYKASANVSVRDLELGEITPSVTQEKLCAQNTSKTNKLMFWKKQQQCLTKPKEQGWLKKMPKKQRLLVKLAIAFLVAGVMIGVAVGIAAAVKSPVYGTDKTVGEHNQ